MVADDMSQSSFFRVFRSGRYIFSMIFLIPYVYNLIYLVKQGEHLTFLEQTTPRRFDFKDRAYRASWGILIYQIVCMAIDVLHMSYKSIKLNLRHGNDLFGVKLGVEIEVESIDRKGNVIPGSKKKTSAIEKDTGVNYYHRRVRQFNILAPLSEKTLAINYMRATMSQHGHLTCQANKFNTFIISNYNLI